MSLKEEIQDILEFVESNKETIKYNQVIFEITEGNLFEHLRTSLASELTPKNLEDAITRAAPINVLRKVFSKLSKLYSEDPIRKTESQADQDLIDYYTSEGDINTHWSNANFNFNAYKNTTLELYHDEKTGRLRTRSIPSMQFMPYSNDFIDPTRPTHVVKYMGKQNDNNIFWMYSDENFIKANDKGAILDEDIENPYKIMPFTYINRSSYKLLPIIDSDTVQMAILICKLLVDVNFSSKYLANPIVYGVDMNIENLERSPNIFWDLKSMDDKKPEIGVVKADADIQSQIDSLMQQVSFWLQTRDIRPGTVGNTNAERASSGISLIIQEMDTTENVNMQKKFFEEAENDFWKRLAKIHNYLAEHNMIENKARFSDPDNLTVSIEYAEQKVIEDRTALVERTIIQLDAGLLSKKEAIKRLNPKMADDEIDELLKEVESDNTIKVESFGGIQQENREDD